MALHLKQQPVLRMLGALGNLRLCAPKLVQIDKKIFTVRCRIIIEEPIFERGPGKSPTRPYVKMAMSIMLYSKSRLM